MAHSARWTVAATVSLAFSVSLSAQQAPPPQQEPVFGESIDVRVVNVEAVVTDRGGKRVRGLKAGDFKLLVDGREVPVDYFAEVEEGSAVAASSNGCGGPAAPGEEVGRSYLVLIDEYISIRSQRDDLLKKLKLDLNLLRPSDRMAVLAFDGVHIEVLANWTQDAATLAAAIDKALARPSRGLAARVHLEGPQRDQQWFLEIASLLDDGDSKGGMHPDPMLTELAALQDEKSGTDTYSDAHKTADAAASALRAFEAPPGRKVMLLLTGVWTLEDAPRFYGPLIGAANRLGYSVYPIDSAQSATDAIRTADGLARLTGGTALAPFDNHFFKAAVQETGSYYWLGFTPSWRANDRNHQVAVLVQGKGLTVRSRHGFSDLSKASEASLRTESVLLFGGTEEEKKVFIKLGAPRKRGRELEVPVTLAVPIESLAIAPEGMGYGADVPLNLAAMDEKGGRSSMRSHLKVNIAVPPAPGNYVKFQTVVRLSDLAQRLVFTLPDARTGRSIWGDVNLERHK